MTLVEALLSIAILGIMSVLILGVFVDASGLIKRPEIWTEPVTTLQK
jgi:type II secretory pathway pseudopilin PulG